MPQDRPNIVYILADDQGYGDVSCLNPDSKIPTPHMDSIARDGMIFTDAHSNSAVCTPTRYGVLTGRYCFRSRLKKGVLQGYSETLVEAGRTTAASFLKKYGYSTACIGKWHLGLDYGLKDGLAADAEQGPETIDYAKPLGAGPHTVGFDHSCIIPASLDMPPYCYIEDGRFVGAPTSTIEASPRPAFWRGGQCAPGFMHETCLLELTVRCEEYINRRARTDPETPFFLYFPTPSPHTPHFSRGPFAGKSRAGEYGDYVVEHDWAIGRIAAALERNGFADDTLLIVTSDNGCHAEPIGLKEKYDHLGNYIYRGQKSDAWDGGHRIPFIARWPGVTPQGATCGHTVCLTDLLATVCEIVGGSLGKEEGEDSCSILPYLRGASDVEIRPATVHHSIAGQFAIRQGKWKLVECRGSGGWSLPEKAVPENAPPMQLYDMHNDPSETHNVYDEHPDVVRGLLELLNRYRTESRSVPVLADSN